MCSWSYATASVPGTSHIKTGTRLQDAFACFTIGTPDTFVGIVSDGAGSAKLGGEGASLVCRVVGTSARRYFYEQNELPNDLTVNRWVECARDRITAAAENRDLTSRDFAATLIAVIAQFNELLVAHIGDGSAVGRRHGSNEWEVLSWPENGEYASTTYFVTDDPYPKLRTKRIHGEFSHLAVFSDGIERLVLDFQQGIPSTQFFDTVTNPFEDHQKPGKARTLSVQLAKFLGSERVNERTDDDKTLMVAKRV